MTTELLLWLIPLLPLLAFGLISLFSFRSRGVSHGLALGSVGLSWLGSMVIFFRAIGGLTSISSSDFRASRFDWLPLGKGTFQIGMQLDQLSTVTLFFVAWTVLMIFIYSVGYHNYGSPIGEYDLPGLPPHGAVIKDKKGRSHRVPSVEPLYSRFFAFFALFAFAMYLLVLTDNLLVLYIAWEIMGLCSYLLIGFWYARPSARDAAVKAFITTRVGDMFMLIGLAALYSISGTLSYHEIFSAQALEKLVSSQAPVLGLSWAGLIGLLIFFGTIGKSAQFPLHVWLPDAMEGPTPVSAMIHAATMVSAGVYLALRTFPLISAGWAPGDALNPTMMVMATIGAFTALFAALIAVGQNDMKRVLAYSTISQLGFMIAALGIGAYVAAAFHLVTHAFFKALLFLGSGSVIHGMEHGVLHTNEQVDPQNMFKMGGLRKKMPLTFWTFLIGGFALSGFPLVTAGFWSKDEILSKVFETGHLLIFITLALSALITAFYTMRQITLTFLGKPRSKSAEHAQESRPVMTLPLVVLAFFAITAGWVGIPGNFPAIGGLLPNWFEHFLAGIQLEVEITNAYSLAPLFTSLVVALGGLTLGWLVYRRVSMGSPDPLQKPLGRVHTWLVNKFYVDELYNLVLVRPAYWLAETFSYQWIDKGLLDGILYAIGRFGLWLGQFFRTTIDRLINWIGDKVIADGVRGTGKQLSTAQSGRLQQYLILMVAISLLIGIFFIFTLFGSGNLGY